MTLTDWLALAAVCLMGAASPGPSLAVIIKHTLAGGRTQGLVGAWCHAGGIGVYAVATGQDVASNLGACARDGLAIALLNPKIAVFFTALFSQFVQPDAMVLSQWAMAGTAVVIDGLWYSVVAVVLSRWCCRGGVGAAGSVGAVSGAKPLVEPRQRGVVHRHRPAHSDRLTWMRTRGYPTAG